MKTHFRLYTDTKTDFQSSIFDLINGDKETKQTKGLAYVFSQYEHFLFSFLEFKPVKDKIKKCLNSTIKYEDISSIEVSAERLTLNKRRADIVIKIDTHKSPLIALIIEAKSIKTNVNQQSLAAQISNYLDDQQFPELSDYKKIGIVLTKYSQSIPDVVNISWENISNLLWDFCTKLNQNEIITQYLKFLTQIDKSMKYYEKEVLSIPAGKSLTLVQQHNIYVCPDTKNYNYKRPLFVTFRQANGGVMDKLYKIEDIIILNPTNPNEIQSLKDSTYPDIVKTRISNYLSATNYNTPINYDERFYILSETESIDLSLKPKPQRNNAKFTYYTLKEILTKNIVTPESQQ
ncbi:MAG TPA: hypothetical protein PKX92_13670 [Edaphocola sp.]|nr:hypothetical protein [Edaphocola sp.]